MKLKQHEPSVKPADYGEPAAAPEEVLETVSQNITCSYGIHRGNFPVAGLKVKDARAVLKKLMKIDDKAAAVINGQVVDENTVISTETTLLSFVKPSAVKGAVRAGSEVITITDRHVRLDGSSKQLDVDKFCGLVAQNTISGLVNEPIPDNVKYVVRAGKLEVYIIELKPELRWIKWIAEGTTGDSGDNRYKSRKLATPYVVMSVTFYGGQLQSQVELFYRNQPLASLDDPLSYCNLLNVSVGEYVAGSSGFKTWVCTQYLNTQGLKSHADILSEIISHVFGGGFNRSSDRNEGASGFSMYEDHKGADPRTKDVNRWEQESEKNPRFVLDVDWIKADATPRDLIYFRMKQFKAEAAPETSKALGNILLASPLLV